MSVYKRKNSKFYYCEVRVGDKTIIRSTKTTKKNLAILFESKLKEQLYRQYYLGEKQLIDVQSAIDLLRISRRGNIKQRNLTAQCKALEAQLSRVISLNENLLSLDTTNLAKLVYLRRQDGVSEGTIKLLLVTISSMLKCASEAGYMTPDNLIMPTIKVKNQRTRVLSFDEEKRLLDILENQNTDNYDLVVLLLDTAARLNEIQHLKWKDIDFDNQTIKLWRNKNHSEGIIKLTNRSYQVLKRRRANAQSDDLVFPSTLGGLRYSTPKTLKKAYEQAELEGFTTHCLRHTACTRLLSKGMSITAVSKLLGHSSVQISQRYAHLSESFVANQAADIFNQISEEISS